MQAVGRLGSYITRGVCTVSGPFLPFGGAVDIVVVQQKDGTFKSSPWYVRFGKLHRVMKANEEKLVHISVNDVETDFHMCMNPKGEAFFLRDIPQEGEEQTLSSSSSSSSSGDDEADDAVPSSWGGGKRRSFKCESFNFGDVNNGKPVTRTSSSRRSQILGLVFGRRRSLKGEVVADHGVELVERAEIAATLMELKWSTNLNFDKPPCGDRKRSNLENELHPHSIKEEGVCDTNIRSDLQVVYERLIHKQQNGEEVMHAEVLHATTVQLPELTETGKVNKNFDLGMEVMEVSELHSQQRDCSHPDVGMHDVEDVRNLAKFGKCQTVSYDRRYSSVDKVRANTPTSEQLASLNLKEGRNTVTFSFSNAMLGKQQVDARIYLWKWNTRIVISDVDGTITRSDVLGQVMPWVGLDWSQTGVAHLFSSIKENGYQLLFLSARAISQAYHTRQFLSNLKQDGKVLPDGPVVISPDGLFPSLYREVIRRAPHEFKIACLEDIRALFPPDCNPFYAGFGNRDTDEISYLKVGIPKGKIFIINPRGEIAVNRRCLDTNSYTSLHALVNGMFPPKDSSEQEDFNSWNYWKLPSDMNI